MKKILSVIGLSLLFLPLMATPKKPKNNTISNAPAWVKAANEDKVLEVKNSLKIPSSKNIIIIRYVGKNEQESKANAILQAYLNFFEKFTEEYNYNLTENSAQSHKNLEIIEYVFENIHYISEKTIDSNYECIRLETPGFKYFSENKTGTKKEYVILLDSPIPIFNTELEENDLAYLEEEFQKQFQEIDFKQEGIYITKANTGSAAFSVYSYNKKELQELADKKYSEKK